MNSKSKILILGSGGFLGSALKKRLKSLDLGFVEIEGQNSFDLRHPFKLNDLVADEKVSVIINCAARVGGIQHLKNKHDELLLDNIYMSLNIIRAAANSKVKLITPISNCAYPGNAFEFKEKDFWNGEVHPSVYPFATSRRTYISTTKILGSSHKLNYINLVFPNVFGPGESLDPVKAHALGGIIQRMIVAKQSDAKFFEVWGTGAPVREWLFIDDAIDALQAAVSYNGGSIDLLNIGVGKGISIKDLVFLIKSKVSYPGEIVFNPIYTDGALKKVMVAGEKVKDIGWRAGTKFEAALDKTIQYYESCLK